LIHCRGGLDDAKFNKKESGLSTEVSPDMQMDLIGRLNQTFYYNYNQDDEAQLAKKESVRKIHIVSIIRGIS